ncbi:hypothetical protein B0H19DRAFT_1066322 [Mycena capillaripes]|nr:hypothetical protein B0H19DRAFT_1066322 [Mycena capillaripes]
MLNLFKFFTLLIHTFLSAIRRAFDAVFTPPKQTTYRYLSRKTIFPAIPYKQKSTSIAPYSAPADNPPRFVYPDSNLGPSVLSRYDKAINSLGIENHLPSKRKPVANPARTPRRCQQGDRSLVLLRQDVKEIGLGKELKTASVLEQHDVEFSRIMLLPNGPLHDAQAMMVGLGLHVQKLSSEVKDARFGLLVSAIDCYVVELDRIPLSSSSVDGKPSQSLITLLIGMLMPDDIVSHHDARDPSLHARPGDWATLGQHLNAMYNVGTQGQARRHQGGHGGVIGMGRRRENNQREVEDQISVLATGSNVLLSPPPSKFISLDEIVRVVGPEDSAFNH